MRAIRVRVACFTITVTAISFGAQDALEYSEIRDLAFVVYEARATARAGH